MEDVLDRELTIEQTGTIVEILNGKSYAVLCPMSFNRRDCNGFCTAKCAWCTVQEVTNEATREERKALFCKDNFIGLVKESN